MGEEPPRRKRFPVGTKHLIAAMADTTWRMFVPTIGGILLGLSFDQRHGTAPIGVLIGLVIGGVVAGLLIREQLRKGTK